MWAVARSHGGGQGTAAHWHPPGCPLHTLGEGKAGSLLGCRLPQSRERSLLQEGSTHAVCWLLSDVFTSSAVFLLLRRLETSLHDLTSAEQDRTGRI